MPKIATFSLKNLKNRPALGSLFPRPLCLRQLEATHLDSRIWPIPIRILRCSLNYNRHYYVTRVSSDINTFHYPDNRYIRIFGNLTNRLTG